MEVADPLPLDRSSDSHRIVADVQRNYLYEYPKVGEPTWYTARPFVNIGKDLRSRHRPLR